MQEKDIGIFGSRQFVCDYKKLLRIISLTLFCTWLVNPAIARSDDSSSNEITGWSFYLDNDLIALGDRDFDYTGGFAFGISGEGVRNTFLSVDGWLGALDDFIHLSDLYDARVSSRTYSQEFGFTLFTPVDLDIEEPIEGQRPYASLFFINNGRLIIDPTNQVTYQTILTLGVIGLPLAGDLQSGIHEIVDAEEPLGWDNQISAGGEPTFRYSVARSKNLQLPPSLSSNLEIKATVEGNIGFTTDVGVALSLRYGRLHSPWWAFNVHSAEYISMGSPTSGAIASGGSESYFWTGLSLKYRFYNAFIQGQFRSSEVSFDSDELNPVVVEGWLGYTYKFESGLELSGFIRGRTAEIDLDQIEDPVWGGFIIGRSF